MLFKMSDKAPLLGTPSFSVLNYGGGNMLTFMSPCFCLCPIAGVLFMCNSVLLIPINNSSGKYLHFKSLNL